MCSRGFSCLAAAELMSGLEVHLSKKKHTQADFTYNIKQKQNTVHNVNNLFSYAKFLWSA